MSAYWASYSPRAAWAFAIVVLLGSADSERTYLPVCLDKAIAVRGLDWAKMMAML